MNHFLIQFKLFFQLLLLLIVSAFAVYFLPEAINKFLFLLLLFPIWRSKNDFFWFAYLLILIEIPGGLFWGYGIDSPTRLPIYSLAPGVSTSFLELLMLLFFFKGLFQKQWYRFKSFFYKRVYIYLTALFLVLLVVSFILGVPGNFFVLIFRIVVPFSFFMSCIFIFKNEDDIINFLKTIFPFVFIVLLLQLYSLINHQQLVVLLNPAIATTQGIVTGEFMRPIEMGIVLFICFFCSLLFLGNKRQVFPDRYLLVINITSYICLLMTATRSWFLGFTVMYLIYFVLNFKTVGKTLALSITAIVLYLIITLLIPQVGDQVDVSSERLATIETLAEGDNTAGGTMIRLTERGPLVLEGFNKSTVLFGAGYSNLYFAYADIHVGYHNILLHSGIIGLISFLVVALILFFTPLKIAQKPGNRQDIKTIVRNLPLLMPAILVINSGVQFWGFSIEGTSRVMLVAFYFVISGYYIQAYQNRNYEDK